MLRALISLLAVVVAVAAMVRAQEESASPSDRANKYPEVPKEYEVGEDTISPNGQFAILFPVRDENSSSGPEFPDVLVRLKPYSVLKDVSPDTGPAWRDMRGEPQAEWHGNNWVAVWHHQKWGNEDLVVYEIANDRIKREEKIWPEVVKYFDRDWKTRFLKKYPKEADDQYTFEGKEGVPDFEFKDHKLILNVYAQNKPNLAPGPVTSAELHGVWNLETGKFEKVDFKPGKITVRKEEQ